MLSDWRAHWKDAIVFSNLIQILLLLLDLVHVPVVLVAMMVLAQVERANGNGSDT